MAAPTSSREAVLEDALMAAIKAMTVAVAATEQPMLKARMNTECAAALDQARAAISKPA